MSCLRVGQLAIGLASASALAQGGGLDAARCTFNGKPLAGRVQVVTSFPDVRVQVVESFPNIRVQWVTSFPDRCGRWQQVESFPDVRIQYVDSFPDVRVQFVESFPGIQQR